MAAITNAEYVRLADSFLAHWAQVNDALGGTDLTLSKGYAVTNLKADRDALEATLIALVSVDNDVQTARERRRTQQKTQSGRLKQFRNSVLGRLDGTDIAKALPLIPSNNATPEVWTKVLEDMSNLWTRVNGTPPAGFTAPLLLPTGYTHASFTAEFTALKATYTALAGAENTAKSIRETRTQQAKALRRQLIAYRKAVVGALPMGHPLFASLPGL